MSVVSSTDPPRVSKLAETILSAALSKARFVPGAIRALASDSLTPLAFSKTAYNNGGAGRFVNHGQMMGTYLSLDFQSFSAWEGKIGGLSPLHLPL